MGRNGRGVGEGFNSCFGVCLRGAERGSLRRGSVPGQSGRRYEQVGEKEIITYKSYTKVMTPVRLPPTLADRLTD